MIPVSLLIFRFYVRVVLCYVILIILILLIFTENILVLLFYVSIIFL